VTPPLGAPRTVSKVPESVVVPSQSRVFAVAAIAQPDRFFSDVSTAGWHLVGTMGFRDHRYFTQADIKRIDKAARAAAAAIILTTEKDAVRLETCDLTGLPFAAVPLVVGIEPADAFREVRIILPDRAPVLFNLGRSLFLARKPLEAIEPLEAGLRIQEDPDARRILVQCRAAAVAR